MNNQNETTLDLPMADLDHANAYVAAQAMETGADAIAASGKYPAASAFLKRFAGILLDMAVNRAEADGLERRPLDEVTEKMRDAQRRHLN
jgi:hypothetical protein